MMVTSGWDNCTDEGRAVVEFAFTPFSGPALSAAPAPAAAAAAAGVGAAASGAPAFPNTRREPTSPKGFA